jgi:predicted RNase H-like nuclease
VGRRVAHEPVSLVGVDGCAAGWLAVVRSEATLDWGVYDSLAGVVADTDPDRLLLDIPVGLPTAGRRTCDEAARDCLGSRASTVFYTPVRDVLDADTHAAASDANRAATGYGLSIQAWHIVPKIRAVDAYLRERPHLVGVDDGGDGRTRDPAAAVVRESHPELCFAALNGGEPITAPKSGEAGREARLAVLDEALPEGRRLYHDVLEETYRKHVARDDVLDALVLAGVADRPLDPLPADPPLDAVGLPMEIVAPGLAAFSHRRE